MTAHGLHNGFATRSLPLLKEHEVLAATQCVALKNALAQKTVS